MYRLTSTCIKLRSVIIESTRPKFLVRRLESLSSYHGDGNENVTKQNDLMRNQRPCTCVTPQNVIIAAKCNTDAKCNNIDAKCNKVFNAKCNNFLTQNVITFLTHNVITQNVITGVVLRNHYQNPVTFTCTLIE